MGLNIPKKAINRAHRIGKKFEIEDGDEDGNVMVVSFSNKSSWDLRTGEIIFRDTEKESGASLSNLTLT